MRVDLRLEMFQFRLLHQKLLPVVDFHLVLKGFCHLVKGYIYITKLIFPLFSDPNTQISFFHLANMFHQSPNGTI